VVGELRAVSAGHVRAIAILGSTGSIGESALDVVRASGGRLRPVALAAGRNVGRLAEQAREFRPELAVIADEALAPGLVRELAGLGIAVAAGPEGMLRAAAYPAAETVLSAVVGAAGILPTHAAAAAGKVIALANKESLVAAGGVILETVRERGGALVPVDSEHSAIFQLLAGRRPEEVREIVLTASGGPFWNRAGDLAGITPEDALRHPKWSMGAKVSIDSATLMNKGLEVIEAHWLFGLGLDRIAVAIHPQSIVHGAVSFVDGALMAHLSPPDMRLPIAAALYHPERVALPWERLDLARVGRLEFFPPDHDRFPALRLAERSLREGGTAPAVLNAANEVAVQAFLDRRLLFTEITAVSAAVLDGSAAPVAAPTLGQILAADVAARAAAEAWVREREQTRRD
jgi:1-deoxy-D-xylulose-5-phosphate reductoisomerase